VNLLVVVAASEQASLHSLSHSECIALNESNKLRGRIG
jgi:hypothetical protein